MNFGLFYGEQLHQQSQGGGSSSAGVPGGVAALQPRRALLDTPKVRAVNLGGWLVIEKWMKPELFDDIPDGDLLVRIARL
jgi:hypothetical protein